MTPSFSRLVLASRLGLRVPFPRLKEPIMHRADPALLRKLPARYAYLALEPAPRMLLEALKLYGVREFPGAADNPTILAWAREIDRDGYSWIGDMYANGGDAVPWCGVFAGVVAKRAGKPVPRNPVKALAWAGWGDAATVPKLGDILTFTRTGGGHVGFYVGEDADCYHVLGGNQSDSVNITRIRKSRLYAARRYYAVGMPANVRQIRLGASGPVSENEA